MTNIKDMAAYAAECCLSDPLNRMPDGGFIYDRPLVGAAAADDPLFRHYADTGLAGADFRLPLQWFNTAVAVIAYFLPFSEKIRRSNREGAHSSLLWLQARFLGEKFNDHLRRLLISRCQEQGAEALSPALHADLKIDYNAYASNWSERHVAYAAGLGSFGLHRGLITEKGVAGRFGSVITTLSFRPTPREDGDPFHNCSFLKAGQCGNCIERCPAGAISTEGMDKEICHHYLFVLDPLREARKKYGYANSTCGKCQVNVPCEERIPALNRS